MATPSKYGYIAPVIEPKDYILGAERHAPYEVVLESGDWTDGLPEGEPQRRFIETNGCTNWGWLNLIEIYGKKILVEYSNWAERFTAVVSGQKKEGNDPHKVAEAIRGYGVLPEEQLPFTDKITEWEEYFSPNPMTRTLKSEASKWLDKYVFKHEYIFTYDVPLTEKQRLLREALKRSPVGVSVYAWVERNGKYYKPEEAEDNHWTCLVAAKEKEYWLIYDSYTDNGNGNTYLKKLEWSYDFGVAKGFYLRRKTEAERQAELSFLSSILAWVVWYIPQLAILVEKVSNKTPEKPVKPSENAPPPIPPVLPVKLKWGTPAEARHSSRVIMDEYNLIWREKDILCAVLEAESGFNPTSVNHNLNGTIDYGLGQYNDGRSKQGVPYWIGPGADFKDKEEVINNPEKNVRVMIREYKKYGYPKWWVAYTSGAYRRYLKGRTTLDDLGSMKIPDWLLSSTGEGVAMRWKATMFAIIPTLVVLGPFIGVDAPKTEWDSLTGEVSHSVFGAST